MNINPNISPFSMFVYDVSNRKLLVKEVNNIEDVWTEIINTYINNIELFNESQSIYNNFSKTIKNNIIAILNFDNDDNRDIKIEKINELENLFYDAYSKYQS